MKFASRKKKRKGSDFFQGLENPANRTGHHRPAMTPQQNAPRGTKRNLRPTDWFVLVLIRRKGGAERKKGTVLAGTSILPGRVGPWEFGFRVELEFGAVWAVHHQKRSPGGRTKQV